MKFIISIVSEVYIERSKTVYVLFKVVSSRDPKCCYDSLVNRFTYVNWNMHLEI